jgi:hypothetical protein
MKKWAHFNLIAAVAAVLVWAALMAPAQAFEASVSGQVNQLIMWADNGDESDFFIADNDNSSTRFRFRGSEDFERFKIGFRIELEAERNSSSKLDIPNTGDGDFNFNDRWLDAYFDTSFGKISIGKGDGAANGTSEIDLSGTSVITYSEINATAGDFIFLESGTKQKSDITVDDTRNNFDGLSRNERLRYDTPAFGGFSVAGSVTNGDAWELAGYYDSEFGDHKIAAAIGYVDTQDRGSSEFTQMGLSASWLMPFGLNLTAAYGTRNFEGETKDDRVADGKSEDATNYYIKLGYKWSIHALSIEYGMTEDLDEKDDESSNYGVAYVVKPWKGVELYAAGRVYTLDRQGVDFEDISQIMAGTRIKF